MADFKLNKEQVNDFLVLLGAGNGSLMHSVTAIMTMTPVAERNNLITNINGKWYRNVNSGDVPKFNSMELIYNSKNEYLREFIDNSKFTINYIIMKAVIDTKTSNPVSEIIVEDGINLHLKLDSGYSYDFKYNDDILKPFKRLEELEKRMSNKLYSGSFSQEQLTKISSYSRTKPIKLEFDPSNENPNMYYGYEKIDSNFLVLNVNAAFFTANLPKTAKKVKVFPDRKIEVYGNTNEYIRLVSIFLIRQKYMMKQSFIMLEY